MTGKDTYNYCIWTNKSRKGESHMTSHRVRTSPKAFERQPGSRQSSKAATDCSNKRSLQLKFWSPWTLRCQSRSVDELCLFSRSPDQSMAIAMKQLGIYSQGFELILYLRRPHDRNTVKTLSCGNSTGNATDKSHNDSRTSKSCPTDLFQAILYKQTQSWVEPPHTR